jgi:hypothetical protein
VKELAKNCFRTTESRTLSKVEAAQQQLEGAIANLFLGNWACAITLAGAAEGMLAPPEVGIDLFTLGKTDIAAQLNLNEKDFVKIVNEQLYWLKHLTETSPVLMNFDQIDVIIMILRAYTKFYALTSKKSDDMLIFESWLKHHFHFPAPLVPMNPAEKQTL